MTITAHRLPATWRATSHPSWCHAPLADGGDHYSRMTEYQASGEGTDNLIAVAARLSDYGPSVLLHINDELEIFLTPAQARTLARAVIAHADLAETPTSWLRLADNGALAA